MIFWARLLYCTVLYRPWATFIIIFCVQKIALLIIIPIPMREGGGNKKLFSVEWKEEGGRCDACMSSLPKTRWKETSKKEEEEERQFVFISHNL